MTLHGSPYWVCSINCQLIQHSALTFETKEILKNYKWTISWAFYTTLHLFVFTIIPVCREVVTLHIQVQNAPWAWTLIAYLRSITRNNPQCTILYIINIQSQSNCIYRQHCFIRFLFTYQKKCIARLYVIHSAMFPQWLWHCELHLLWRLH